MRRQLTEVGIGKLRPPTTGRLEIFDSIVPALAVRVTPNGAKSFVVRARVKGRPDPIRVTLGDATATPLRDARQQASDMLKLCRAGTDPRAIRRTEAEEASRQRRNTFSVVAEAFIGEHVAKLRSKDQVEKEIRRYLIAHWGKRSIASVTADDVGERIRAIIDSGKPHSAQRVLAHVKRLFRWAAAPGRSLVKANPAAFTAADFEIVNQPRQVVLSSDHLRLIWQAADTMEAPFGTYFKMLLLSGQRRDEVACMTWAELDLDDAEVWIILAERMKAKRPHEVPLSPPMVKMLKAMRKERGKGDYVFSTTDGERPISGYSKAKASLDAKVAELRAKENEGRSPKDAQPAWRIHDIRRTVRTGLGALANVPYDIRELVIAHVPATLVQTYDLHGYRDEKRQALELWSQRLKQIAEPPAKGNVVSLPARKIVRPRRAA